MTTKIERVLLIRHGQTDWNMQRRWQGLEPTALNEAGFEQARALAAYLCHRSIRAVYSSDLPRALQTATVLAEALKLEPLVDVRWRELHVGVFQGLNAEECEQRYPAELLKWRSDDHDFIIPNGESRRALGERALGAWQDIVAQPHGPEVAVVSHGWAIRRLLTVLFGEGDHIRFHLTNTSITTVEREGDGWRLAGRAETPHLLNGASGQ